MVRALISSFVFFLALVAHSQQDIESLISFEVEKYQLKNGLTVLLHRDASVPTVSYHTWFKVGSRDEEPGYTGIAHLFEHMMFKGTDRYPGEEFDRILQANGATNNAFTTHDYTGYYEDLPSNKLELVMDIEADRMVNLKINDENLQSEREVVKEERRMRVDESVMGHLQEVVYAVLYKVHPYKWPVIGWMKDLNRINLEKCREFYKKFYSPNNAVLVIAGDIEISKTKKLIDKYYSSIPASDLQKKNLPKEPEQQGYRFQKILKNVQSETFSLAYKGTKAGDEDAYALDLLANIIASGESSRLYKRLVYKAKIATSVSSYNDTPVDEGLFQLFVSMKPGADIEKAKQMVLGEVFQLRKDLVTEQELAKAKNQLMKSMVDSLKTVSGKAESLAVNEVLFGDYKKLFSDLKKYNDVSAEQIREVAKKYLLIERANLILVKPKDQTSASVKSEMKAGV